MQHAEFLPYDVQHHIVLPRKHLVLQNLLLNVIMTLLYRTTVDFGGLFLPYKGEESPDANIIYICLHV